MPGVGIVDKKFTLPKPLAHLFRHLVNVVFEESLRRGGRAHKDLMSVLEESRSCIIPNPSSTLAVIIGIEQKKVQVIHLVLLTLVHHLCAPFCFHCLGPALDPRFHSSQ